MTKPSTIWIIADTHFGHDNLCLPEMGNRPENFEDIIFKNISKKIHNPKDVLIHLGDISWKDDDLWHRKMIEEIPCKKWLTLGNHDKRSYTWYLHHGWDVVCEQLSIKMYGKKILFSHRPAALNDHDHNIHGHFHNTNHRITDPAFNPILTDKHILIKMEHEYKPVNLKRVIHNT